MSNVLIIGAGPAGIRAAEALVNAGLRPTIVDEADKAGGQIYRRPPEGFKRCVKSLYGSEATKAEALHTTFDRMVESDQVDHLTQSSVVSLRDGSAVILTSDTLTQLTYDKVIIATGASDRVMPVPGWQNAGVFSLGGTQIALKARGVALGQQVLLAGSGPLLTLVGDSLIKAGADVVAVLDTAPLRSQIRAGLSMFLSRPLFTLRGIKMRLALGRRYHAGVRHLRVQAEDTGVTAMSWQTAFGQQKRTTCDAIGMGWHLLADTQLADLAGAKFSWSRHWSQWLPVTDDLGRAAEHTYIAGDGLQILGADAAEIAGRLAATACLQDLGHVAIPDRRDIRRLARFRRFAIAMARAFPWPNDQLQAVPDKTIVCRCEGIKKADIAATVKRVGPNINRVKSTCRPGMGRCQGRYCQVAVTSIIADQTRASPDAIGRLRTQPPVRPIPVSAALDA
ncbi:MAG: FAD/NAD(P)-binding oxidoreductase [Pseudomonadota bacterium]